MSPNASVGGGGGGKRSGQPLGPAAQPEPLLSQWGSTSRPLSAPGLELRGGAPLSWTAPAAQPVMPSAAVAGVAAPAPPPASRTYTSAASSAARAAPPAPPQRGARKGKATTAQRPSTAGSSRGGSRRLSPRLARPRSAAPRAAPRDTAVRGASRRDSASQAPRRRKRVVRKRGAGSNPRATSAASSEVTAVDLLPSSGVQGAELDGVDVVFQEDLERERALEAERRQLEAQMYAQQQQQQQQHYERQRQHQRQQQQEAGVMAYEPARLARAMTPPRGPATTAAPTRDDVGGYEAAATVPGEPTSIDAWGDRVRDAPSSPRESGRSQAADDGDSMGTAARHTPRRAQQGRSPSNGSRARVVVPATPRSVMSRAVMSPGCECLAPAARTSRHRVSPPLSSPRRQTFTHAPGSALSAPRVILSPSTQRCSASGTR